MAPRGSGGDVNITLNAQNRASAAIEQVKGSLKGIDSAAGTAAKGLAGLAGAFGVGAVLGLAANIGSAVTEMAQMAVQSERLETSFQRLAAESGASADGMMSALKRASAGTISEYNLMLAANKAMMLGVADSADELQALMLVAGQRGAAMGLTMEQAFDNLVTGVGRGSALILDNLGISTSAIAAANDELAAKLGVTADKLTDAQKKQAMLNVLMKEASGISMENVEAMASDFEQAHAAIDDMKVALGELFGPAVKEVAGLIRDAAVSAKEIADAITAPAPTVSAADALNDAAARLDAATANYQRVLEDHPREGFVSDLYENLDANVPYDMVSSELREAYGWLLEVVEAEKDWAAARARLNAEQWAVAEDIGLATQLEMLEQAEKIAAAYEAADAARVVQLTNQQQLVKSILDMEGALAGLSGLQVNELLGRAIEQFSILTAVIPGTTTQMYSTEEAIRLVLASAQEGAAGLQALNAGATEAAMGLGELDTRNRENYSSIVAADGAAVSFFSTLGSLAGGAWNAAGAVGALDMAARNSVGSLYAAAEAAYAMKAAMIDAQATSLKGAFLGATDILGAGGALAGYEAAQEQIEALGQSMLDSGEDALTMEFELSAAAADIRENLNDTRRQFNAAEAAAAAAGRAVGGGAGGSGLAPSLRGAGQAASAANAELSKLQSTVSSVLQGALSVDVGVNPDDYLPRPDAINENARRLADIMVNGFKGQDWLGEFAAEVPDLYAALTAAGDPKAAAATFLRDFQDGLVPELIDKEAAKDRVRRMLLGQQTMAQLAQEIAGELSGELGVSMAQAQAMAGAALGVNPEAAAIPGVDGAATGAQLVDTLTAAIANKQAALQSSGQVAGETWGVAFLGSVEGNVPPALITMLAILLTPEIMRQMRAQGARTGAN